MFSVIFRQELLIIDTTAQNISDRYCVSIYKHAGQICESKRNKIARVVHVFEPERELLSLQ